MLGVRGTVALLQCATTLILVFSGINWSQTIPLAMMQFVSACTLLAQWDKSGRDHMYVVRGCASLVRAIVVLRTSACGRVFPPWAGCDAEPWRGHENVRLPFRCIHVLACVRQLANAWSLLNQYHLVGDGVTPDNGHRQLWIRARIRASGIPIQLARFILKIVLLDDTRYERGDVEVACNFMRAVLLIPLSAWSLNHQYYAVWKSTSASGALSDGAAVLAPSSGEEPAPPRHRAGVASMAWRSTRRFSTNAP